MKPRKIPTFSLCLQIAAILFAATLASGCGNNMSKKKANTVDQSAYSPASLAITSDGGADGCLNAATNVTPYKDNLMDGTGYYSACANSKDPFGVILHGDAPSDSICIFPAQIYPNSRQIYAKLDPNAGGPMYQCVSIKSTKGVQASFPKPTNFNAVFVTSELNREGMQACLTTGSYNTCPDFSFGQFR